MNKKVSIIISSIVLTTISFTALYFIEKKMLNPDGTTSVYMASKDTPEGTVLTADNITNYFFEKEINSSIIPNDAIKSKEDLIDAYTKDPIYKNEIAIKNRFGENKQRMNVKDKRVMGLKFTDIGEVVGGVLKKGDLIDIIVTESDGGVNSIKTKTVLQKVYIDEVFSADGSSMDRLYNSSPAYNFNVVLSAVDAHKLENALSAGKVKVLKVAGESSYDNITIVNDN